jgi:hypothetical protein
MMLTELPITKAKSLPNYDGDLVDKRSEVSM